MQQRRSPSPYDKNSTISPISYVGKGYYPTVSPGQYAKFQQIEGQSPLKSVIEEADQWRSRCQDLESSLNNVHSELEIANFKAKKAHELEEKVDMVLKHNAQLLGENDHLQKNYNQKKTESEVWKQKYEQQMSHIINMKASYELDGKKLQGEVYTLKELLDQNQIDKVRNIEHTKSRAEVESHNKIENLKNTHCQNISLYEDQLRKLRDILEDRERENQVLNNKLQEAKSQGYLEATKLNEDKEHLKMRVSLIEMENQKEREFIKRQNEENQNKTIANLKKHYENEIDVLQSEVSKCKGLLGLKAQEIANYINQNKNLKQNFEEEGNLLRLEIQELKNKVQDTNEQKERDLQELKDRLVIQHTNDLNGLKFHTENQIDALQNEIDSLKAIINDKSHEIDEQIKEKLAQRDNYNQEIDRLNKDIEMWKFKHHQLERQKEKELFNASVQLENEKIAAYDYQKKQEQHIQELTKDVNQLQYLLQAKQQDQDDSNKNYNIQKNKLEEDIQRLRNAKQQLEVQLSEHQHQSDVEIKNLKMNINIIENEKKEQFNQFVHTTDSQKQEIRRLQDTLDHKNKETSTLQQHKLLLEDQIRNVQVNLEQLRQSYNDLERYKNDKLEELRIQMDNQHIYAVDQIQRTHDNQIQIMQGEIQDLHVHLQLREKELQDYISKYEKVEVIIRDFVRNPNSMRDKAEVATIKNLYESLRGTRQKSPSKSPTKKQYIF